MLREEVSKKLRQRYIRDDVPIALQQAAVANALAEAQLEVGESREAAQGRICDGEPAEV